MKYCFTELPPEFQRFELAENSMFWRGFIRGGSTLPSVSGRQMINLCRDLLNGDLEMIKDRPKIAAGIGSDFFVKLYKLPGMIAQACRRFRHGRAIHCLMAAEVLQNCGAITPQVVAAFEMRCGRHIYDFLITEKLPDDALTLGYFFNKHNYSVSGIWDFLLKDAIPEVVRIHDAGIAHGDLNLRNMYQFSGKVGFIDLDSVNFSPVPLNISAREKELARFLSGFLRFEGFKSLDVSESASELVVAYHKFSQVQCSKENIIRRANYLLDRLHR